MLEGHLMADHVHMSLSVPPKFSLAFVIGFLKGKSAVLIHRRIMGHKRVTGMHFWARGYCVSTDGLDEQTVRKYIREQEAREKAQQDLNFEQTIQLTKRTFLVRSPPRGGLLMPPTIREETH